MMEAAVANAAAAERVLQLSLLEDVRICKLDGCNGQFTPPWWHPDKKYCCMECVFEAGRRREASAKAAREPKGCEVCGAMHTRDSPWCSNVCYNTARCRKIAARRREELGAKECKAGDCDNTFLPKYGNQKYCLEMRPDGRRCTAKNDRRRHDLRTAEEALQRKARFDAGPQERGCLFCSKTFPLENRFQQLEKWCCSDECKDLLCAGKKYGSYLIDGRREWESTVSGLPKGKVQDRKLPLEDRWQTAVQRVAREDVEAKADWAPILGPVYLSIVARIPTDHKVLWGLPCDRTPDEDNIIKTTQDGLREVVIEDDGRVSAVAMFKEYCQPGLEGADIMVTADAASFARELIRLAGQLPRGRAYRQDVI